MKLFVTAAFLSVSGMALANGAAEFPNCKKEIAAHKCSGDAKAVYECLAKHDSSLSPECEKDHSGYETKHGLKK